MLNSRTRRRLGRAAAGGIGGVGLLTAALVAACGAADTAPTVPGAGAPGEPRPGATADASRPGPDVEVAARFDDPLETARWSPFDDVIMGGVSSSSMLAAAGGSAVFSGVVSLDNEGGFASVRSSPRDWSFAGARGIALRVRGDGHTYKVNARTSDGSSGGSWQCAFPTKRGEWTTVRLAFEDFVPRLRGEPLDAGPLPPGEIRTLGLLITDKQAGPFRLEVAWIGAWLRAPAAPTR